MIILFSSSLGLMAVNFKKKQLSYIDSLIYIAQKMQLMLSSTSPETEEIMNELKSDERLKGFDFELLNENCPLSPAENDRTKLLFNTVGKYDLDCQLSYIGQYIGFFKMLKQEYQNYYNSHYKLYLVFGLFSGVFISVLLI